MDLAAGLRKLATLERDLRDGRTVEEGFAAAVAVDARRRASGRPTPQARMAASALVVRGNELGIPSGAVVSGRGGSAYASEIAGGSEYGSGIYRQFGPRRGRPGAWLGAAAEHPTSTTMAAGDRALDELVERAIR
jgi:hypothetical protein